MNKIITAILLAAALTCVSCQSSPPQRPDGQPAAQAQVQTTPAQQITSQSGSAAFSNISPTFTAPLTPGMNAKDLQKRLTAAGRLVVDGTDLVLREPSLSKRESFVIAANELEVKNGGTIITGGHTLVLIVNTLTSDRGSIVAFKGATKVAKNGTKAGENGYPGQSGGVVTVYVFQKVTGALRIDVSGQDGGNGAPGGQGSPGPPGIKGDSAVSGLFGCQHGGADGSPGGMGGPGGKGGDAGQGGAGGEVNLYGVKPYAIQSSQFLISRDGGLPGHSGEGGTGGPGGPGGEGGNGAGFCGGGRGGPTGPVGPQGAKGQDGSQGPSGKTSVQSTDPDTVSALALLYMQGAAQR